MPTITAGGTPQTIALPEGQVLNVSGGPGTTGVVYRLDQALGGTNSLQSWPVGSGALAPIGPYAGEQRFLVTCSAGSINIGVENAVLAAPQFQKTAMGAVLGIAYAGMVFSTAVLSLAASGDLSGATDTANIAAYQAIIAASNPGGKKASMEFNGSNGAFYLKATNITGSKFAAIWWTDGIDMVGKNSPRIVLAASTEPNGYGGHVFFCPNVSFRATGLEVDGNRRSFISPPAATSLDGQFGSGFYVAGSSNVWITNNWIHGHIYHGVLAVDDCSYIHTDFNRINDNGYRAVHYNANDTSSIINSSINFNDVYSNGMAADNTLNSGIFMALGSSYRIEAIGNNIRDEKAACLHIAGFVTGGTNLSREITASMNHTNGGTIGILITANLQDSNITGNISSDASVAAFQLGPMVGCKVNGNTARRARGPGMIAGATGTDAIIGSQINDNHFIDCDGSVATNRAALYFGSGAHKGLSVWRNTFLNNGMTGGTVCGGIANGGGSRMKCLGLGANNFIGNRGHAIVLNNVDDALLVSNTGTDNFEASGPRGSFISIGGTSNNTHVLGNVCSNDGVVNNVEQYLFGATTTNSVVAGNYGRCAASTNVFRATAGATGVQRENIGQQRWNATFAHGSAAPVTVTVTANYVALNTDVYVRCNGAAAIAVTLPTPVDTGIGKLIMFKNLSAFAVTFTGTVDGSTTFTLAAGQAARLISNGASWDAV
ncbi:hypothetical protein CSZ94_17190 [Janthinobacterium sp. ROICE36]|uniref:hypothetical protein n=1 Tax=Janthinobacterium sp. ROICE36 TaxID=2048670 RepID=UPI000C7EFA40|nr:hypothetical protein [Janthinobacterium sp. ROICE36]PLY41165.1 hypothetical protein CSZ94_17190 [Janthinobacterium sp. ROICE36]